MNESRGHLCKNVNKSSLQSRKKALKRRTFVVV